MRAVAMRNRVTSVSWPRLEFAMAKEVLKRAGVHVARRRKLSARPGKASGKSVLLACGYDSPGLVYALLDLADRVRNGAGAAALQVRKPLPSSRPTRSAA